MKVYLLQKMSLEDGGYRTSPGKGVENVTLVHVLPWLPNNLSELGSTWIPSHASFHSCLPIYIFLEVKYTLAQAGSRISDVRGDTNLAENNDPEDAIQLLDEAEAPELVKFDLGVDSKKALDPHKSMTILLEKHFNPSLSNKGKQSFLDCPKHNCHVMSALKLDEQVKDQLNSAITERPNF